MRILGIDYGTKRVGLAVSDESETIAFPFRIMNNDAFFYDTLLEIIDSESIGEVLIGASTTSDGQDNSLEAPRRALVDKLRQEIPVFEIDERFSSHEARLREFGNDNRSNRQDKRVLKEHIDAEAAQIILQRYLDKKKQMPSA